jgi:hypothetical protein
MTKRARVVRQASLSVRIQRLTREVEKLVPEVKAALETHDPARHLLAAAATSLERAAAAVKALADAGRPEHHSGELRAVLEGTSPFLSLLGSRVVLARAGGAAPRKPSAAAQALALLLEEPTRTFETVEIAEQLGCSVPIARTTLHRLVQGGYATRAAPGRFRAKAR